MLRQFLLFPHSSALLAIQARRPMEFRLLVELDNGFISYLRIHQRTLPDPEAINETASTLTEAIHHGYSLAHVSDLISDRHGLSIQVLDAPFFKANTWNVEQVVNASLASAATRGSVSDLTCLRLQLLAETGRNLRDRIDGFLLHLDAEILAMQERDDLLPSRYNYLVGGSPVLHRNRLQALRACPWVMQHILWDSSQPALAQRVRQAIDLGQPLVSVLAAGLAVAPSTVKCLKRCPVSVLASAWHGNIQRLAQALDTIKPEFRPMHDDDWTRMAEAVTAIEQVTGHSIARPQNQLWLAAAARRKFVVRMPEIQDTAALTVGLADMRNALRDILALRLGNRQVWPADWLQRHRKEAAAIEEVIGRALGHVDFGKLLEIVRRWQDAFRRHQATDDAESVLIRGLSWRAPLDEFQCEDRIIVPLLSQAELVEEGNAMGHCVGSYSYDCRLGRVQVWSIRARDGRRCSTLATRFKRHATAGWAGVISEHRAQGNAQPDVASRTAAQALIRHLSASHEALKQFWEWRQTLAPLSPKDRGMLLVTRAIERSLAEVLPKKLSLESLAQEVERMLQTTPVAKVNGLRTKVGAGGTALKR